MDAPASPNIRLLAPGHAVARTKTPRIVAVLIFVPVVINVVVATLVDELTVGPAHVLTIVALGVVATRLWRCRVELTPDTATVVNPIRTYSVPRAEIAQIEVRPAVFPPRWVPGQHTGAIDIVRRDGTRIWAVGCSVLPRRNLPASPGKRRLVHTLQHWARTGRLPSAAG